MKKIFTVVGARPQFIKAAPLSRCIKAMGMQEILVHTGQHFDANMSEVFFREMEIPLPGYNLDVHSLSHGAMTGRMLEGLEKLMLTEKPDWVIVFGDTNSTLAGALAACKLHIPVAHVEAGLRSFNMEMPEEINRILTDRISNLLFCPTDKAVSNLHNEGFDHFSSRIIKNGDVMLDAALYYSSKAENISDILDRLSLVKDRFVLCTIHRQENTDNKENLEQIITGLNKIVEHAKIVFPIHPRTQRVLKNLDLKIHFEPIDPVGYFDMVQLLKHCQCVITDSGGVQKEAFYFRKLCLTLRNETEWTELVDNGFNLLTGADSDKIFSGFMEFTKGNPDFSMQLYGDGHAANIIAETLYAG